MWFSRHLSPLPLQSVPIPLQNSTSSILWPPSAFPCVLPRSPCLSTSEKRLKRGMLPHQPNVKPPCTNCIDAHCQKLKKLKSCKAALMVLVILKIRPGYDWKEMIQPPGCTISGWPHWPRHLCRIKSSPYRQKQFVQLYVVPQIC